MIETLSSLFDQTALRQGQKEAILFLKKGRIEFRADKSGIIHLGIGKMSMEDSALVENIRALYEGVLHRRPSDLKGEYIKSMYVSATMSPGINIDYKQIA